MKTPLPIHGLNHLLAPNSMELSKQLRAAIHARPLKAKVQRWRCHTQCLAQTGTQVPGAVACETYSQHVSQKPACFPACTIRWLAAWRNQIPFACTSQSWIKGTKDFIHQHLALTWVRESLRRESLRRPEKPTGRCRTRVVARKGALRHGRGSLAGLRALHAPWVWVSKSLDSQVGQPKYLGF